MKYLFLDFDGVLHGYGVGINVELFEHSPALSAILRKHQDKIRVVISSSWRETYPMDVLYGHLDEDVQHLVVGITPSLIEGMSNEGRHKEIKKYCHEHHIDDNSWIAMDDMPRLFPVACPNLICTLKEFGLSNYNLKMLEDFILIEQHNDFVAPTLR